MNVAFVNPFIGSLLHVFKEMVDTSCIVGHPFRKDARHRFYPLYSVAAAIQLSGPVSGMIALDFSEQVATALGSAFAKETFSHVDDHCADALREIVNVVAGWAKKDLPGGHVSLSIAKVVHTYSLVYPPRVTVIAVPFDTDKGRLVMEVALQGGDLPPTSESHPTTSQTSTHAFGHTPAPTPSLAEPSSEAAHAPVAPTITAPTTLN